ncbi:hypothetical protein DVA44_03070 [Leclercia sp. W17]|nr:hypothetical protein DVA44_03070 [Leclercia sp. W17]
MLEFTYCVMFFNCLVTFLPGSAFYSAACCNAGWRCAYPTYKTVGPASVAPPGTRPHNPLTGSAASYRSGGSPRR